MASVPENAGSDFRRRRQESSEHLRLSFDKNDYYSGRFPNFQMPKIVGEFSVDEDRSFRNDRSQMKFYNDKRFNRRERIRWDLNAGMDKVVRKGPSCKGEGIQHILRWLVANKSKFSNSSSSSSLEFLPFDFVCLRGLLTKMMTTLYEDQEDWEIQAIKIKGTIYLCAKETDLKKEREMKMTPREEMMCSWGFKFEQYVLTSDPSSEPAKNESERNESLHEPVNENEEFCCLFKSKLNDKAILYAAEMDGFQLKENHPSTSVDRINLLSDGHFIELKTSIELETDRQIRNFFKFKSLKWWAQAFLVGIQTIICGFRDESGLVCSLKDYKVDSLPKMAVPYPYWNGNVCMNFLDSLLSCIKNSVKYEEKVYSFTRPFRAQYVECKLTDSESFLPHWYLEGMYGPKDLLKQ